MRREELDVVERGPTADELAEECRCYDLWRDQQEREADNRRWRAGYRRYLSTSDEPKRVA